jgi:hypothetical protein
MALDECEGVEMAADERGKAVMPQPAPWTWRLGWLGTWAANNIPLKGKLEKVKEWDVIQ